MNDDEKSRIGKEWAEILMIPQDRDKVSGRHFYWTSWGKKTALGIYETIMAFTKVE